MTETATAAVEGGAAAVVVDTPAALTGASTEAAASGADSASAASGADTLSGSAAPSLVRPEGLPDDLWDDAIGVKVGDLWAKFRDLTAQAEAAKADLPADAKGYDLKPSADVKLPDGMTVEMDPADPFFADVTATMHAAGIGKGVAQKLIDAFARRQISVRETAASTYATEKAALGENAKTRLEAIDNWLTANLPKEEAMALIQSKTTATAVKAFEKIIALRKDPTTGGGGHNTSQLEGLRGADMLDAIRSKAA